MEKYLRGLLTPQSTARNAHEAAIELQREYEDLVSKETEIKTGASKGRYQQEPPLLDFILVLKTPVLRRYSILNPLNYSQVLP